LKQTDLQLSINRLLGVLFAILAIYFSSASLSEADISSTRNFYQFNDQLLTSGQPGKVQLESASADGVEVVINIVPSSESIFNPREGDILAKQGIEYLHTPVNWKSPKDDEIVRFIAAMDSVKDRTVLVHCWANARASALVHVYRMIQNAENREADYKELKLVWKNIAGYNLEHNDTWKQVIEQFSVEAK